MMSPIFSNRENEPIDLPDGRTIWHARCCAVVAHVFLYDVSSKHWYVLLGQRGPTTPDFQGYWGLPCGYLDWDETLAQAMVREVWEECGVFLPALKQDPQFVWSDNSCIQNEKDFDEQPWVIADVPKYQKQNISMHYSILFAWKGQPFPRLTGENAEPGEVSDVAWIPVEKISDMTLAFNHTARILELLKSHPQKFQRAEDAVKP